MEKKIKRVIKECIRILEFQLDYYEIKPSEYLKILEEIVKEIKENTKTDEQYKKEKEEEKNEIL